MDAEGGRAMKEKQYKYRIESYQLFEYQAVEEHLERMARRGWQLEQVGNFFWKYRREDPRETSYAVTYLPELSAFDPEVTPASRTLDEYCEEAGWEKVCDWTQMQIYRTDQADSMILSCDHCSPPLSQTCWPLQSTSSQTLVLGFSFLNAGA